MTEEFWIASSIVVFVLLFTLAKALAYSRKSCKQWREFDKSKLKVWEDDD
jgi:hypothetical protein